MSTTNNHASRELKRIESVAQKFMNCANVLNREINSYKMMRKNEALLGFLPARSRDIDIWIQAAEGYLSFLMTGVRNQDNVKAAAKAVKAVFTKHQWAEEIGSDRCRLFNAHKEYDPYRNAPVGKKKGGKCIR